jgi:hypothetical protein
MLYFQFECMLCRCVLEGIMLTRLGNVGMLLCLVKGGFVILHILPGCGW